ncbi:MAG: PorT family protein [Saprospiraceae bacterium]|nr:PorT family protein [Saprospiraceae bacterium]
MKKLLLIIAAVALMANISTAQDNEIDNRESLQFGLKVGINNSNVYDTEGDEFSADSKFGFAGGLFVTIPIGYYFGIQPEILFSQKGFQATGSILGSTYNFTRTTNYIDIPLLFSVKPSEFISILVGPQYSYLISTRDVFGNATTTIATETEFENDNIRKNTFCFTAGLDINIDHIVVSGRVGWDLMKNNGDGTSTTPRYKNVWYQATVGYRF